MKKYFLFCTLLSLLILSGCEPSFIVRVNSISDVNYNNQKSFILLPGNEGVNENDLQFKEYSRYVKYVLEKSGLKEAEFGKADIAIFLSYGIGNPEEQSYSYSVPVYGIEGAKSSNLTANTYNSNGSTSTTNAEITTKPNFGIIGYNSYSETITNYFRYIILDAIDLKSYQDKKEINKCWETTISSTGSSDDLRRVFPIMVAATQIYIGKNTGENITIDLHESDNDVQEIKSINQLEIK
jgi:hypothetical protein